jgi:hypothetical protein
MVRGSRNTRHHGEEEDDNVVYGIEETEEDDVPVVMSDVDYILGVLIKRDWVTLAVQKEKITEFHGILDCRSRFNQFTLIENGVVTKIGNADIAILEIICKYYWHLKRERGVVVWTDVTLEMFTEYRTTDFTETSPPAGLLDRINIAPGLGQASPTAMTRAPNPLQDFEKGIRRDKLAYLVLKDDKEWDNWRRSTIATARTHKCAEIFDANYIPKGDEERALFQQKQLFMYSVFDKKLQTDMGKNLVRTHESLLDAQSIYTLLAAHATTSTRADIESQRILSYVTSTRFGTGDSGWRGTSHSFVLH